MQVSNTVDAIKIAIDMLDQDSLPRTEGLITEFRDHRLAGGGGEDVLQFHNVMWYAWNSLNEWSDKLSGSHYTLVPPGQPVFPDRALSTTMTHPTSTPKEVGPLRGNALKKEQRKRKQSEVVMGTRPAPAPGNFACPICFRLFHRANTLSHL